MKKILTIALVALLAASTAFAGISGSATLGLGYNTKTGAYGFSNDSEFSLDLDLATEPVDKAGEGDVYAGVKATMTLKAADRTGTFGAVYSNNTAIGLGFLFSLDEAYVAGQDWKVAITGTQKGPDFAKSAIDKVAGGYNYDDFGNQPKEWWNAYKKAKSYSVSVNQAPGVTVSYKDWSVALGFEGGKADTETGAPDYFNYHASVFTPSFALAEGITVKAAAVASGIKNATDATESSYYVYPYGKVKISEKIEYVESDNFDAFGASAEIAYASDAFSGKLDADFGMTKVVGTEKFVPGLDIAANAIVSGFTIDAYYQYGKEVQFISAQVKADLNTYEVPVVLTVYGKNIADKDNGQTLGGKAESSFDAFTLIAGGSYTLSSKKLALESSVKYEAEEYVISAGANFSKVLEEDGAKVLYANASVSSDVVVPGATLTLAYGPNTSAGNPTSNFLDSEAKDYGKFSASCKIAF